MSKRYKRVFKIIWVWNEEKEEKWLSEMAQKGWLLESYFLGIYTFSKAKPDNYIYKLDYYGGMNRDKKEYRNIFEDAGWEHVAEFAGWQYFRIKADNCKYPDIYSDNASKVEKYRSLFKIMMIITLANLINMINVVHLFQEFQFNIISGMRILISVVLLLLIYADYRIYKIIKELKREL